MKNSPHDTDAALVEQVKQGDVTAFRLLVERYRDVLFSLACTVLRNEHDAEDALQEALIKAFRSIGSFRGRSSFATWLYRIVLNTCFSFPQKHRAHEDAREHENTFPDESGNGFEKLADADRSRIINQILDKMKMEEALLLRLFYLSELDMSEIMEVTGFKTSKVKVTLFRARKSFSEAFLKTFGTAMIKEL